jgi:ABC-type ATPase involved in cell division
MPCFDIVVESDIPRSGRIAQLEGLFDVPKAKTSTLRWGGSLPIEDFKWNVGLIVGPSGCGKTTILQHVFGSPKIVRWDKRPVIDNFDSAFNVRDISEICQAVGFNTIPAWMRPYRVLSNGEQFRVDIARRLSDSKGKMIVIDEFTSVVDRQVAKIAANAVQKYIRKKGAQFVAASCHYDIIDWLQPDWIFEPATMKFARRSLQRRPQIQGEIARVPYDTWHKFSRYHYLTAGLHRAARCWAILIDGQPVAFAGLMHRPTSGKTRIIGVSRLVTLPDWQGLGLAFILVERLGAALKMNGYALHTYPAHMALIRSFDRSPKWSMIKKPSINEHSTRTSGSSTLSTKTTFGLGARPCGVFRYTGETCSKKDASILLAGTSYDRM